MTILTHLGQDIHTLGKTHALADEPPGIDRAARDHRQQRRKPVGRHPVTPFDLEFTGDDAVRGRGFYDALTDRTASIPGVQAVSLAARLPLAGAVTSI